MDLQTVPAVARCRSDLYIHIDSHIHINIDIHIIYYDNQSFYFEIILLLL